MAASFAWYPTFGYMGHLPMQLSDGETMPVAFKVQTDPPLPSNTTEVQVYAYISVQEMEPGFQRGYYEIYTESIDGKQRGVRNAAKLCTRLRNL